MDAAKKLWWRRGEPRIAIVVIPTLTALVHLMQQPLNVRQA